MVRDKKNPGIFVNYTLTDNTTVFEPVYKWTLGDWTACSKTCGGGSQKRVPVCQQESKGVVDEDLCWSAATNEQPNEKQRTCNEDPCPSHWWVGQWQPCPVTCRHKGTRFIFICKALRSDNKHLPHLRSTHRRCHSCATTLHHLHGQSRARATRLRMQTQRQTVRNAAVRQCVGVPRQVRVKKGPTGRRPKRQKGARRRGARRGDPRRAHQRRKQPGKSYLRRNRLRNTTSTLKPTNRSVNC